jgi:hypothetical protein
MKGPCCFRCDLIGHHVNDCETPLCDVCHSAAHTSNSCPILSLPKPAMIMHGYAQEQLMFFEVPMTGDIRPRVENTRMGRVTVHNGTMTIPKIISQLQWVVPDEHYQH